MNSETKSLKLKELKIELDRWGEDAGKYTASVEYEGEFGTTKLTLDPEISSRLLAFIGPAVTTCAHKTSLKLEEAIKQSLLEAQKLPELEAVTQTEAA